MQCAFVASMGLHCDLQHIAGLADKVGGVATWRGAGPGPSTACRCSVCLAAAAVPIWCRRRLPSSAALCSIRLALICTICFFRLFIYELHFPPTALRQSCSHRCLCKCRQTKRVWVTCASLIFYSCSNNADERTQVLGSALLTLT